MKNFEVSRDKNGTIEQILVNRNGFNIHSGAVDHEGTLTKQDVNQAVAGLYEKGLLKDQPNTIYALTTTSKPVTIRIKYDNGKPVFANSELWLRAPNLDAALCFLADDVKKKSKRGILVTPQEINFDIKEESAEYIDENPYKDLARFEQETYDASLPHPELKEFVGKSFGGIYGWSYMVHYKYKNDEIYTDKACGEQPAPGKQGFFDKCLFEITRVNHLGFHAKKDFFFLSDTPLIFQQELEVNLKYIEYCPELEKLTG